MILEVKGKKLVFGMTWRPILGRGALQTEAAKIAKEEKSDRIWHDGQAHFVGVATGEDASAKIKDTLYSGAIALASGKRKNLSTLFVYRLGDAAEYVVCGIIKGKPSAAFDALLVSEEKVQSKVLDFADRCDGSFTIAGNVDGLRELIGVDRDVELLAMDLAAVAASAEDSAKLRSSKVQGINTNHVFRGMCVLAIGIAGWVVAAPHMSGLMSSLHIPFFHHEEPVKSPQQIYDEALQKVLDTQVIPVAAITDWEAWWSAQPFLVGGWQQNDVVCNAKAMAMACTFTYVPNSRKATNLTFDQAKPASWPQPRYTPDGKTISIVLRVTGIKTIKLRAMAKLAPTTNDLALHFGSTLQEVKPISDRTNIGMPQLFPGGVDPISLQQALYSNTWSIKGPLRNVDVLADLPRYATLTDLHLEVNLTAQPKPNQSKLMLTANGLSFSRK